MTQILEILENQKEVKYLTYFISQDQRLGTLSIKLSASSINKQYKFKDEDACLSKLYDILLELKRLETWALKKMESK